MTSANIRDCLLTSTVKSGAPNEKILLYVSERRFCVISELLCDVKAYL